MSDVKQIIRNIDVIREEYHYDTIEKLEHDIIELMNRIPCKDIYLKALANSLKGFDQGCPRQTDLINQLSEKIYESSRPDYYLFND